MKIDKREQDLKAFYEAKAVSDATDGWDGVGTGSFIKAATGDVHIVHRSKNLGIGDQLVSKATTKIAILVSNFTNGQGRTITAGQWQSEGWARCEKPIMRKPMGDGYDC